MIRRTRFAPSPTGLLHVGNAYSALKCHQWAEHHGELLLRIEDIDATRCRPEYSEAIIEDLTWLGLSWKGPIRKQSEHIEDYTDALTILRNMGVIYPCFCTRSDIQREIARMASAPHEKDHSGHYPGTCRNLSLKQQQQYMHQKSYAWRLDVEKAMKMLDSIPTWQDEEGRHHPIHICSDVVIGRKDIGYSYHLAVVVDDALQGITHIIRGRDLSESTGIHRLLQTLLGFDTPTYIHHELLLDTNGQRLAKRNGSTTLQSLHNAGISPLSLRNYLLQAKPRWPFVDLDSAINALTPGRTDDITHSYSS